MILRIINRVFNSEKKMKMKENERKKKDSFELRASPHQMTSNLDFLYSEYQRLLFRRYFLPIQRS
jgi:hypothetical protein